MNDRKTKIEERRLTWSALSELFLDTELGSNDYARIAERLAVYPYPTEKIEEILRFEVTPALKWNLLVTTGEWVGFNDEFLCERISSRMDKKPLFRFPVLGTIRPDWLKVKAMIKAIRNEE